jgi:hypothetical protein
VNLRRQKVKSDFILFCFAIVAAMKDLKKNISSYIQDLPLDGELTVESSRGNRQRHVCMEFLQSIDQTGELTDMSAIPVDVVKYERNVRAERSSRVLDETRWVRFLSGRICCLLG